jgi:hypothetical protein
VSLRTGFVPKFILSLSKGVKPFAYPSQSSLRLTAIPGLDPGFNLTSYSDAESEWGNADA